MKQDRIRTAFGEERAVLARQMRTYLNRLDGAATRALRDRRVVGEAKPVLETEEALIGARLAGLPSIEP